MTTLKPLGSYSSMAELYRDAQAEIDRLTVDAERYRWLRDETASLYDYVRCWSGNTHDNIIDFAIDAARKEPK
jgi:hypothetical protein